MFHFQDVFQASSTGPPLGSRELVKVSERILLKMFSLRNIQSLQVGVFSRKSARKANKARIPVHSISQKLRNVSVDLKKIAVL
jgi:hypothetical protein